MNKERTNCRNCGAPIEHRYNHQCPYCDTFFDYRVEKTKEIDPKYMTNVKVIAIERSPIRYAIKVMFEGDYKPYFQALEYGKSSNVFVVDRNELIGQKVRFMVEVPYDELISKEFNPEHIMRYLPFEMDKEEILKALWEYKKERNWF